MKHGKLKSSLLFLAFFLVPSSIFASGFFLGKSSGGYKKEMVLKRSSEEVSKSNEKNVPQSEVSNRQKILSELELLRSYINFIYLPQEQLGDTSKYVSQMNKNIAEISEEKISEKYLATGKGNEMEREKSILEFLNFLMDDLKVKLSK